MTNVAENVAKREDNSLAVVNFPTLRSVTQTLGQPQYNIYEMQRLIDYKLPVSSDVMKAVMINPFMWKEYDTRLEKQLQNLARKKAQLSSDITRLQNSRFGKQLQELGRKEAHLSIDIELLQKYRIRALDLKPPMP